MKPAKIYNCETCRDAGYVYSASRGLEACPDCAWGATALAQSQTGSEWPSGQTARRVVKSDALADERRTPAQVGRALKVFLYAIVAAGFWVFNQYLGDKQVAEDKDVPGGPYAPGPNAGNDFSPWEPEP